MYSTSDRKQTSKIKANLMTLNSNEYHTLLNDRYSHGLSVTSDGIVYGDLDLF